MTNHSPNPAQRRILWMALTAFAVAVMISLVFGSAWRIPDISQECRPSGRCNSGKKGYVGICKILMHKLAIRRYVCFSEARGSSIGGAYITREIDRIFKFDIEFNTVPAVGDYF